MSKPADNRTRWIHPLQARSPDESHRAATPLELFFDLVFVVAVAQAGSGLHHAIADGHAGDGVVRYAMVFFAIWWAWMNFTWFASAYDTDDVVYRLATFVQIGGALILAAGVSRGMEDKNFEIMVLGYVVMRLALVTQWLRAASGDPPRRACNHRYAVGISLCQLGWVLLLLLPSTAQFIGFVVLAICELGVPAWAERRAPTTWHPGHIAERYGLFTIIVLGESILAATVAIQSATLEVDLDAEMLSIIAGGFLIALSIWWLYFDYQGAELLTSLRTAFIWGYGHLIVFASVAAVGAGVAVAVDHATEHAEISSSAAGAAVAIPVAVFIISVWILHYRLISDHSLLAILKPSAALLILLTPFTPAPVLLTGLLSAGLVSISLLVERFQTSSPEPVAQSSQGNGTTG